MSAIKGINSKLSLRIFTGCITAAIALTCLILGGFPLLILVLVFTIIGAKEYVDILKNKGFLPFFKVIVIFAFLLVTAISTGHYELLPFLLATGTITSFLAVLFKGRQPYIANVATTILGFAFCWLPCHIILIRQINANDFGFFKWNVNDGLGYLLMMFFIILATDVGAYWFGTKFGKHKLAEVISPKKTFEGAIYGGILAVLVGLVIGYFIELPWYHSLIASILITSFAQLGDLSESLIKRDAGVKDSSDLLPGHGGFMDRADSYIFSAPVAYYYFKYFVVDGVNWYQAVIYIKKVFHVIGL